MNVQRFTAPSSREALAKARMAIGDTAVILSSRSTREGFEVIAAAEESLMSLTRREPQPQLPAAPVDAGPTTAPRSRLEQRAAQQLPAAKASPDSSVAQDTETLAMSTLSFQDYVRERMLRKRSEMMQAQAPKPAALPQERTEPPARAALAPRPQETAPASSPTPTQATRAVAAPARERAAAVPAEGRLAEDLKDLRELIEERFNTLAWIGQSRQNPIQSGLTHKLIRAGYSPVVARAVMEKLPSDYDVAEAFRWTQEVLTRNLRTVPDAGLLCDEGGVFALVGPTGVGKTTTAAKLAAQCVKAYGPASVGLISLDAYRVGGYEQLRAYGRLLGVVGHQAQDRAALQDLLGLLAGKRMVIVDTAGLSQKDARIQEMLELLEAPTIKKVLVLNAGSHGDTLDEVVAAYRGKELYGVILSKLDEAAKLGPALDAAIRHQLVLRGVCTGQRVPEDWHRPYPKALVRMSMASQGKSAQDPQPSELAFFLTDASRPGVQLDAWHV
jgi:flagellar biosynthesis protein FlhF